MEIQKTSLVEEAIEELKNKDYEYQLERLPALLKNMTNEEKLEMVTNLLCNKWYTFSDFYFIKQVLKIYEMSLLDN